MVMMESGIKLLLRDAISIADILHVTARALCLRCDDIDIDIDNIDIDKNDIEKLLEIYVKLLSAIAEIRERDEKAVELAIRIVELLR